MITNYKRGNIRNNTIRNNTISSSRSLLQIQGSGRSNNNNSNKKIHNYSDNIAINSLEIADGLKELLTKYDFTLNELLSIPTTGLAEFLGIDRYIAQIIGGAATKLSNNIDNGNEKLQTENYSTF
jgi:hypothetical protein